MIQNTPNVTKRPPPPGVSSSTGADQSNTQQSLPDQFNLAKMFMNYFYRMSQMNEQSWLSIGRLAISLLEPEKAKIAFEQALKSNPHSLAAVQHLAHFYKQRESFLNAIEYYQKLINMDSHNSDAWSSLAFCYLMQDDIQKAFSAYQQALFFAPNSKDPYLWYGLGILYERHGSDDQAEEFFVSALRCDPSFEKSSEIFYRLGIIFKNKKTCDKSTDCFQYIMKKPPKPLSEYDIRFQLGQLYEMQGDYNSSREIFGSILNENPRHIRTIQYCAWNEFNSGNLETGTNRITACLEIDGNDPISWYILGRCQVAQRNFNKSYEAYQQAVLRNGKNPIFWCSIGLLYFQIQQYRDALDAFSKAIHLNSNLWEVWWNLGILYETCNNQITDAIDSYKRALEVDPSNVLVHQRLTLLKNCQQAGTNGSMLPNIPSPVDLPFSIGVPPPWQLFSKRNTAPPSSAIRNVSSSTPSTTYPPSHRPSFTSMNGGGMQRMMNYPPSGPSPSTQHQAPYQSIHMQQQMHQRRPPLSSNLPLNYSQLGASRGSVSGPGQPPANIRYSMSQSQSFPPSDHKGTSNVHHTPGHQYSSTQQQPAYYYPPPQQSAQVTSSNILQNPANFPPNSIIEDDPSKRTTRSVSIADATNSGAIPK